MATIPIGNFGNVMPQAQPGRVLDTGAGQVAQAAGQLGQVGQQVAVKQLNEEQKIQDEKDEYFFSTQAAKYGAEYTDVVTDTKQRIATGEFNELSAKAHLRQRTDELNENYRQTLPETKHEKFNYYSEKVFLESETNIKPLAYEVERKAINTDFEEVTEATLKIENREQGFALFKNTLERNPVLTPEQRKLAPQQWNERRDLSDGKTALNALETAKDVDGLQQLHDNIDTVLPHLKMETRDAFKNNIQSTIERINKGLKVEQDQALREIKQVATDFRTDAYTGYPMSPERVEAVLNKVKGTEYEAQVREDLALNKDAQKFRDKSPIEQEREITRLTSQLENTPQADASLLQKQLSMYQAIANTSKQRSKDDPIAQIQSQTGTQLQTVKPEEIGTGKIDFKKSHITTEILAKQKEANGGVGSLIQWNTSERKAFIDKYHTATPEKQAQMLSELNNLADTKTEVGRQARAEYMALIGGERTVNDYVGIAQLKKLDVYVPGTKLKAANLALEGKQIITQGQHVVLGDPKQFILGISQHFGNTSAVSSPERVAYQNIAYSIYLGLAKDKGIRTDEKGNPIINKDLAKDAFELATGGTYHQKLGTNTQTVYRPYGVSETQFADQLEHKVVGNFYKETGEVIPRSFLKEHAIEQVPKAYGWYWFRNPDGSRYINPKTKKAYMVNITK
ncbi:hypothetical protein [Acinetobacter terrae]|uniref:Uncharacterized protein n=1 Tax=Acinetobacter terrae TaxID=2731247 RepID=A0A4R0EG67_9GAMM|nr:hypothetical protein [Acinetobacter terrae]TCB55570.1 hypothetical protein E0H85_14915 [Acinetobacter terrae]